MYHLNCIREVKTRVLRSRSQEPEEVRPNRRLTAADPSGRADPAGSSSQAQAAPKKLGISGSKY